VAVAGVVVVAVVNPWVAAAIALVLLVAALALALFLARFVRKRLRLLGCGRPAVGLPDSTD
jgi:Flp pilus assembly protein TadB